MGQRQAKIETEELEELTIVSSCAASTDFGFKLSLF
jgi:hypothetical protein